MIKNLKINFINNDELIGFIYGFIIFLSCQPYFVWGTGKFVMILSLIPATISALNLRKFQKYDLLIIPLFAFYFIYLYADYGVMGLLGKIVFFVIPFTKGEKLLLYLKWFTKIFTLSLLLSLIVYILVVLLGVPIGYHSLSPLNELKPWDYNQYPFFVIENHPGFEYRFCGMFDEPGVVGSIVTVLLFADNYNLRKKQNIILFLAGIFSFSFFFILGTIFFLLYLKTTKIRLTLVALFFIAFFATRNNDIVYYMVWERFEIEDGKLKGDNRSTDDLDAIYAQFLTSNDVLWGKGAEYASRHELDDSCTYKLVVLNYGMVFFIVVCLAFTLYSVFVIKQLKYILLYCFLFLGMMYQRPGLIYDIPLFFLMISSIYGIKHFGEKSYENETPQIDDQNNPTFEQDIITNLCMPEAITNTSEIPLVSVVVITYNSSNTLLDTLNSIKNQTYLNIELIISDDCSTDNTVALCRQWLDENKNSFVRTLIIEADKNSGTPANCNRGLNAANGDWIKFIAADDALLPDCITDHMLFISINKEIKIIQSECEVYRGNFEVNNFVCNSNLTEIPLYKNGISAKEQYKILLKRNCVLAAAIFAKKELLLAMGGYDEDFHLIEDLPMWLKITRNNYKIHLLEKPTVKYRLSNHSVMKDGKPYLPERYAKELLYFFKKYKKERSVGIIYHYSSLLGINLIIKLNRMNMNNSSNTSFYLFKIANFFLFLGRRRYRIVFNKK